nr:MAG TPA: hypothetical protein [Caudoviricetes sp.]
MEQKSRDELLREMQEQIKAQQSEHLTEVAMPGVVQRVHIEDDK